MLSTRIWNQFAVLQLLSFSITVANWQDMFDIEPRMWYLKAKVLHLLVSIIMVIGVFEIQSMLCLQFNLPLTGDRNVPPESIF
jgi:hypothetical protein